MSRHQIPCRPSCDRERHAALRRLADACDNLFAALLAVTQLPPPPEGDMTDWWSVSEDTRGLLWAARICSGTLQTCSLPCCWSKRQVRESDERLASLENNDAA